MIEGATRTVMLSGHELAYLDSGEGPAVLFIHGLTNSSRSWARLVDTLNTDHRIVAPDLHGHGASAPRRSLWATTRSARTPPPCGTCSIASALIK